MKLLMTRLNIFKVKGENMESKNYIFETDFDIKNPIRKLNIVIKKEKFDVKVVENLLEILHKLNEKFTKDFSINLIYFLDDKSIYFIASRLYEYSLEDVTKGLAILEKCNLIYRFTCAKKFRLYDDGIKQLRINSWGEEYYRNYILKDNIQLEDFINDEVKKNYTLYEDLVRFVSMINKKDVSDDIKKLNNDLNIKLAS